MTNTTTVPLIVEKGIYSVSSHIERHFSLQLTKEFNAEEVLQEKEK